MRRKTLNTYLKKIDRNMFYSKKLTTNYWISLINEKKISHNDEIYTFKQPESLTNYFISIYKHKENLNSKIKKIIRQFFLSKTFSKKLSKFFHAENIPD